MGGIVKVWMHFVNITLRKVKAVDLVSAAGA